jgi:hypothetical protein
LAENKQLKVLLADLLWEKNTAGWLEISGWKVKRIVVIYRYVAEAYI